MTSNVKHVIINVPGGGQAFHLAGILYMTSATDAAASLSDQEMNIAPEMHLPLSRMLTEHRTLSTIL